jgi:peptide/nickel transport system substrate-binding protein
VAIASVACAMLVAACSSTSPSTGSGAGTRVQGGTATIALTATDGQFNFIYPMLNFNNDTTANVSYSQYLMWRPLYWFGSPGHAGLNESESLADPASVTTSGGTTTATIQLKPYRWSDGTPLTSRDVEFWINLLRAGKANFWGYVAGEFPDNLTKFKILSSSRFSLTFDHAYSATWLYNQLGLIIPLPQHAWDRESANGQVSNYDLTSSGAAAVNNFLLAQNKDLSTYATNPLWQVVDGPWKLSSYAPATGDATLVRNTGYSGPATGSLHAIRILSFTSDTAEFDALLSASGVDFGYVPFNDAAQTSRAEGDGYTVQSWPSWGITYVYFNFASPQAGAIFRQLYVRQAMQHLINQAGYIDAFLSGYAYPTYGPVPLEPFSSFVSPQQEQNPYPYDPAEAVAMLRAHGWQVTPNGTDTCVRPGSAASECGVGVTSGAKLSFPLLYANGTTGIDEEVAALQSSFATAGIKLAPSGQPFAAAAGALSPGCAKSNCWELGYVGESWFFDPGYNEPDGAILFGSNAPSNIGSYSDPKADDLIAQLGPGGIPAFYAYQNYLAKQLPGLWMPQMDTEISAVTNKLKGALPPDPLGNLYPEDWYFVK